MSGANESEDIPVRGITDDMFSLPPMLSRYQIDKSEFVMESIIDEKLNTGYQRFTNGQVLFPA
jgi:hypothetical protein